jgi:2-(1,2-epoxy-1,2-dihydrophenyl)acetyl-CoA isomerase
MPLSNIENYRKIGIYRAIAITKALTNRSLDVDRATALLDEAWGQELVTTTEDMKEGVAAFVERRDPKFRGY